MYVAYVGVGQVNKWERVSELTGIDLEAFLQEALPMIAEWAETECPKGSCGACHVCLSKSVMEKLANPIKVKLP